MRAELYAMKTILSAEQGKLHVNGVGFLVGVR